MRKVVVIGAGISGMTVANLLKDRYEVKVYEKESMPGGLIRCERVNGGLHHICGGHVFNSKRQDVLDWFWGFFEKEIEFTKVPRNSIIFMEDGAKLPYPIENYTYLFDEETQRAFIKNLISLAGSKHLAFNNLEDFFAKYFWQNSLSELF